MQERFLHTEEGLLTALLIDPPSRFAGAREPLKDYRGIFSPLTFQVMAACLRNIDASVSKVSYWSEGHFGSIYDFKMKTIREREYPLARHISYRFQMNRMHLFQPRETIGLYGLDDEGISFGIEVTRYKRNSDPVDVYKIIESESGVRRLLNSALIVPDITSPKLPTHVVSVGGPEFSESYQKEIVDRYIKE